MIVVMNGCCNGRLSPLQWMTVVMDVRQSEWPSEWMAVAADGCRSGWLSQWMAVAVDDCRNR